MKVKLSKERDSMAMTAKKLGRDLAKVGDSSNSKCLYLFVSSFLFCLHELFWILLTYT